MAFVRKCLQPPRAIRLPQPQLVAIAKSPKTSLSVRIRLRRLNEPESFNSARLPGSCGLQRPPRASTKRPTFSPTYTRRSRKASIRRICWRLERCWIRVRRLLLTPETRRDPVRVDPRKCPRDHEPLAHCSTEHRRGDYGTVEDNRQELATLSRGTAR